MKQKVVNESLIALKKLLSTDMGAAEIAVCLASVEDDYDTPLYMRLQLSEDLTDEFRSVAQTIIEQQRATFENGDLQVRAYNPGSKLDSNEIEHIDLSSEEFIGNQIESLGMLEDIAVFKVDKQYILHLRFHIIIVTPKKSLIGRLI